MKVKYIGTCQKTDSIAGAGLRWEPGQVRDVTGELAERLVGFTDTWVAVGSNDAEDHIGKLKHEDNRPDGPLVQPIGLIEPEPLVDEPLAVVDFHSMTKKEMADYSQTHFNVKLDSKLSEGDMRHTITGLQSQHNDDTAAEQARLRGK